MSELILGTWNRYYRLESRFWKSWPVTILSGRKNKVFFSLDIVIKLTGLLAIKFRQRNKQRNIISIIKNVYQVYIFKMAVICLAGIANIKNHRKDVLYGAGGGGRLTLVDGRFPVHTAVCALQFSHLTYRTDVKML